MCLCRGVELRAGSCTLIRKSTAAKQAGHHWGPESTRAPPGLLRSVAPQQRGHASTCPCRVTELCARVPPTREGLGTLGARTAPPGLLRLGAPQLGGRSSTCPRRVMELCIGGSPRPRSRSHHVGPSALGSQNRLARLLRFGAPQREGRASTCPRPITNVPAWGSVDKGSQPPPRRTGALRARTAPSRLLSSGAPQH